MKVSRNGFKYFSGQRIKTISYLLPLNNYQITPGMSITV